jgi:hypothetical protein
MGLPGPTRGPPFTPRWAGPASWRSPSLLSLPPLPAWAGARPTWHSSATTAPSPLLSSLSPTCGGAACHLLLPLESTTTLWLGCHGHRPTVPHRHSQLSPCRPVLAKSLCQSRHGSRPPPLSPRRQLMGSSMAEKYLRRSHRPTAARTRL